MSGGLKVGDLYVLLSAKTSDFGAAMESAAKTVEHTARRAKRALGEIGKTAGLMAAAVGAAVALAAKHNRAVAVELENQKAVYGQVASEIAQMMLPALREMSVLVRQGLGWWQSLSAETKGSIGHWVAVATAIGLAAAVLSKVAGLAAAIAPAFGVIGSVLSIGLAPLIGVAVAIGAIIIALGYLHKAWRENWGGIQDKTASVINFISGAWQKFKTWLATDFFNWFIDQWAAIEKAIAHAGNFLKHPLDEGKRGVANDVSDKTIDQWLVKMKAGAMGEALTLAKQKVEDFAMTGLTEFKGAIGEAAAWIKNKIGWTGEQGHVNAPGPTGGAATSYSAAILNLIAHSLDTGRRVNQTSSASGGGLGVAGTAETFAQTIERMSKQMQEAWDAADWSGVFEGMSGFLLEQMTNVEAIGAAIAHAAQMFISKLGGLGEVINAGIQGFQSGGIWGAILAVFVEILSKFKRFQELIDVGNGQVMMALQDMAKGLGSFVTGFKSLMGGIESIAHAVHGILAPIIGLIGKLLGALAPVFEFIGIALEPLMPILNMVCDLIGAILVPILQILNPILLIVAEMFLAIKLALTYVELGLNMFVDWIDSFFGSNNKGGIASAQKDVNDTLTEMSNLWDKGLSGVADQSAAAAEGLGKLGNTADSVAQQLTNIPQGFKIALAEFNATLATSSSSGSGGGSGGGSYSDWQRENDRQSFRHTGNSSKPIKGADTGKGA